MSTRRPSKRSAVVLHRLVQVEGVAPGSIAVLSGVGLEKSAVWKHRRYGNQVLWNGAVDDAGRLLGLAAVWLVSPIDLIPEFIPVLGPLDDAVVAALVLRHIVKVAGREVVAEHWRGEESTLDRILRVAGYRREVD